MLRVSNHALDRFNEKIATGNKQDLLEYNRHGREATPREMEAIWLTSKSKGCTRETDKIIINQHYVFVIEDNLVVTCYDAPYLIHVNRPPPIVKEDKQEKISVTPTKKKKEVERPITIAQVYDPLSIYEFYKAGGKVLMDDQEQLLEKSIKWNGLIKDFGVVECSIIRQKVGSKSRSKLGGQPAASFKFEGDTSLLKKVNKVEIVSE